MKKLNKVYSALICAMIGSGLLHANPKTIDIYNISKQETRFILKLIPQNLPYVQQGETVKGDSYLRFKARGTSTIESIKVADTNISFDLRQQPDGFGVAYDGTALVPYEIYKNYAEIAREAKEKYRQAADNRTQAKNLTDEAIALRGQGANDCRIPILDAILIAEKNQQAITITQEATILEQEARTLTTQAQTYLDSETRPSTPSMAQRAAAVLSAMYTGLASGLTSMQKRWKQWRESGTPQHSTSALQQIKVYNNLPFTIEVNGGGYIKSIGGKNATGALENSTTFNKNIEQLDIYQPILAHESKSVPLRMIDLSARVNSWKPGHNLVVTITEPTWYDKVLRRPISYSLTWERDTQLEQSPVWPIE
jgi:hypothetical protein